MLHVDLEIGHLIGNLTLWKKESSRLISYSPLAKWTMSLYSFFSTALAEGNGPTRRSSQLNYKSDEGIRAENSI